MIMTAYLVVNATSVYTAGDTHITDMQLEALGSDALKMMATPDNTTMYIGDNSSLRLILENNPPDGEKFKAIFLNLTNNRSGAMPDYYTKINSTMDYIQFYANYTCRDSNNNVNTTNTISYSRNLTGGEHTVRATKWVIVNKDICGNVVKQNRAVLVEVLLWRD
jgi:hypothetical protein